MVRVKRVGILSFAKLHAVIGGGVGLVFGVLYSFGGLIADALVSLGWIVTSETPGLSYGTVLAFGALLGMPVIGLGAGFVFGVIGAVVFNLISKWFGGVEVDFK